MVKWKGPQLRRATTAPSTSPSSLDRKSTRLNSSHTEIYTLSLHDALPILASLSIFMTWKNEDGEVEGSTAQTSNDGAFHFTIFVRSEEHTSELQSHRDLHSFPTRRSSDLGEPFDLHDLEERRW